LAVYVVQWLVWIQGWKDRIRLMEFGGASKPYVVGFTLRWRVSKYVLGINKPRAGRRRAQQLQLANLQ